MKEYVILLKYKGAPIKADCEEDADFLFRELYTMHKEDVINDCDIIPIDKTVLE